MRELVPGSDFGDWRIDRLIGRGGMGVVYLATDRRLNRPVAIKLIADERAGDQAFRERFEREAQLTAAIDHPNVIPVYAAGEVDGARDRWEPSAPRTWSRRSWPRSTPPTSPAWCIAT